MFDSPEFKAVFILLFNVILVYSEIYFISQTLKQIHLKKTIFETQTSKIGSLTEGFSEICGIAIPLRTELLKSPISNKDCIYYKCVVEKYVSSKNGNGSWDVIESEENWMEFFLNDDTGRILINPQGAEINLSPDFEFQTDLVTNPPEAIKQFLLKKNLSITNFLGIDSGHRYREYIITPNDKVYVLGTVSYGPSMGDNDNGMRICNGGVENIYYISDKQEKDILKELNAEIAKYLVVCIAIVFSFFFEYYLYTNQQPHLSPTP